MVLIRTAVALLSSFSRGNHGLARTRGRSVEADEMERTNERRKTPPSSRRDAQLKSNGQACKLKFRLRDLISWLCCVQTSHAALKADSRGSSGTQTGNELSQSKFEFTGLFLRVHNSG